MRSLITSIFLYACGSWTLTAVLQRRIQAMEMRCYCKIPHIPYKDHVTNEEVYAKIQQAIGPHEDLTIIKRRKLQWYGHVSRSSGLAKTVLQSTVKGGRRQGYLDSWCFEPSQQQRITSGLKLNLTLSQNYSFQKSSYHKSFF